MNIQLCAISKVWRAVAGIGVLLCVVAYAIGYLYCESVIVTQATSSQSKLSEIAHAMRVHTKKGVFPTNFDMLNLDPSTLIDSVSGAAFVWQKKASIKDEAFVIVSQPKPYRNKLWPFGEFEQWGVLSDGSVTNILAK